MARRMRRKQVRRPGAMAIALALLASERASSAKSCGEGHQRPVGVTTRTKKFSG